MKYSYSVATLTDGTVTAYKHITTGMLFWKNVETTIIHRGCSVAGAERAIALDVAGRRPPQVKNIREYGNFGDRSDLGYF